MSTKPVITALLSFLFLSAVHSETYYVTNTHDSSSGSLRQAMLSAEAKSQVNSILFNIATTDSGYSPTSGVWTIRLQTHLPEIKSNNPFIYGNTQSNFHRDTNPFGPEIELSVVTALLMK
jgi:hypothetical protein